MRDWLKSAWCRFWHYEDWQAFFHLATDRRGRDYIIKTTWYCPTCAKVRAVEQSGDGRWGW